MKPPYRNGRPPFWERPVALYVVGMFKLMTLAFG
jgi:hypothetical protein